MNKLLINFLKTGKLNQIHLDIGEDEIFNLLGVRSSSYDDLEDGVNILNYGDLELTTYKKRLFRITIRVYKKNMTIPKNIGKLKRFNSSISIYKFVSLLNINNIKWKVEQELSFNHQICLVTNSNVKVYFLLENKRIDSIQIENDQYINERI